MDEILGSKNYRFISVKSQAINDITEEHFDHSSYSRAP